MDQRLNLTLKGEDVLAMLELRSLLEKRLKQHLSVAQVVRRLTKIGLDQEKNLDAWSKAAE